MPMMSIPANFSRFIHEKASQMFNDSWKRDDYPSSPHNSAHQEKVPENEI